MTPLYRRFRSLLRNQAQILEAGCGSGRDARAFAKRGYAVTAFVASPALLALAERHVGKPVHDLRFQDIAWHEALDGMRGCASLLHVPAAELRDVMRRMRNALKPRGILYGAFKYGSGEREHHGRRFTDLDEPGLAALRRCVPDLEPVETWSIGDLRPATRRSAG
jgi:SAM-dependent methyltransferase